MEQMGVKEPISIFTSDYQTAEFMKSMRDLASLAGVLKELSTEKMYDSPIETIRFLNVIQLINEASLGIKDAIDNEEVLYYRYQSTYPQDNEPPTLAQITRMLTILERNNWIVKQSRQIKMRDRGKNLMDGLIRMGNDALAYYLQDDIGRSLFQARRDAEISAAYDDQGISGGNKIASMIYNVEEAIKQLEERQLELLADRNALPQLEKINQLMLELETKLNERLQQFGTVEESTKMSDLMRRGTAAISKGTSLSLSLLTKYIRFVNMQLTPTANTISPEKVRQFILAMHSPEANTNIPTAHDILSFMEQNQYEEEGMDGLWVPVKFAAPIGPQDITDAVHYLQTYEPKLEKLMSHQLEHTYEETEMDIRPIKDALQDASWKMTQSLIDTERIEHYLSEHGETEMEELIVESSSNKWHDAILSLLAVSALTSNKKVEQQPIDYTKDYEKQWEWIDDDDKRFTVRQYPYDDE